ncbi:major histocompatibility complex class I-related gene protein-like isoform X1 [Alosa alosa]|uniref:major histocompatibility complex class I-related gene protein-like isoform X1 n=2 Tax=Alosa alosa TaxID=278164 RepID=UPI0020151D17|nr:major histocompatibility complex class I-related gene protein-like isoform X1 [Alosa alosa]
MPKISLHIVGVLCIFCILNATVYGAHSLLAFATYIKGHTPFHEFSAVLMLDDIQVGYYSSKEQKLLSRGPMNEEILEPSDQKNAFTVFTMMHEHMSVRTHKLMHHYNSTHGVQFHQRIFGCDLQARNRPGRMVSKESFNGDSGDEKYLSIPDQTLQTEFKWPGAWDTLQSESFKWVIADFYQPICINALHTFLEQNKRRVRRKVKPRVRLFQKALPDTGGAKITCLATGFYPRHINLTLLRDGQSVSDHQITGGELLPNGDETYQMRKSLEVSAEELQQHRYTCTAEHLGLDNKLDIPLDYEPFPGGKYIVIVVVLLACLIGSIIALLICRRKCKDGEQRKEQKEGEDERTLFRSLRQESHLF